MEKNIIDLTNWSNEFTITYGGQLHQINANTFANSLISIGYTLDEINNQLDANYKIEVHIQALSAGSFKTKLKLIPKKADDLFQKVTSRKNLPITLNIIQIFIGILALKQAGGSIPPQQIVIKDNKAYISTQINGNLNTIVLPHEVYIKAQQIYKNDQIVHDQLSKNFETLQEDPSVSNFGISKDLESTTFGFCANKDNFGEMAKHVQAEDGTQTRVTSIKANLGIIKMVFGKSDRKWEFVWNGVKISANIDDEEFFERMAKGEKFGQGDNLEVNMDIHQTYDPFSRVYLNDFYTVIKVLKHNPAKDDRQITIDSFGKK